MRAGYGEKLREFFVKNNPLQLIDFGGYGVFDSATVDVNILLIEKNKYKNKTQSCTMGKDFDSLNQLSVYIRQNSTEQTYTKNTWCILNSIEQSIKEKIERIGTPLKDWNVNINYGIKTGLNEAFIIDGAKKDELIAQDPKSAEIIRPILRGRDIKRYSYEFADKWLINTHNGSKTTERIDVNNYPAIKEHLDKYWEKLVKRDDQGDTPYNLRCCAYTDDFNSQIIAWQRITQKPTFCLTEEKTLVLDSMAFLSKMGKYKYFLLAVLNSNLIYFWVKLNVHEYGNTGFRLSNQYVEQISIPFVDDIILEKIEPLVIKALNNNNDINNEIDIQMFIYNLYGITKEEQIVIEEKIS